MNLVLRARKLLRVTLQNAAKSKKRCFAQAAAEVDVVKNSEIDGASDSIEHETQRGDVTLDPEWKKWWEGSYSKHPGKCKIPPVRLPKNYEDSVAAYLREFYNYHPREKVLSVCQKLCDVLAYRPVPKTASRDGPSSPNKKPTKRELMEFFYGKDQETHKKERLQNWEGHLWKPIVYDRLLSVAYLIGRSPGVYAATFRVLNEIKMRDPDFQPKAMLDYGSGTGTALWAAHSLWGKKLEDFYCVDWSNVMNELSQYLLTGGGENAELTGIYLRLMLPVSFKHEYDVVTAAYTLSELPSEKDRLTTMKLLWEKTKKYLVIIERGEQQGYHMIMEARNLIANGIEGADPHKINRRNSGIQKGYIFAPCPHSKPCPKWKLRTPCRFTQSYFPPLYAKKFLGSETNYESFSYIILSKEKQDENNWPRVITDPHYSGTQVTCHLCAPDGQLHHIRLKPKTHKGDIRKTAKKANAGDRLPYDWKEDSTWS